MTESSAPDPEPWPYEPADEHGWPARGRLRAEAFAKALSDAKLELRKKRADEDIARAQAERDADLAIEQEYYKSLIEVAKNSIDRTRIAAETVQKAAGAIITLYTGALALSFSVAERPLPVRGLYAALLLGLAVVLSTAFVAYPPDPEAYDEADRSDESDDEGESTPERLSNLFIRWSRISALDRVSWLRASVLALGFGLIFPPAPFISGQESSTAVTMTAWPSPDPVAGRNIELRKILYQAQVEQAATTEAAATEITYDMQWMMGFIGALILVVGLPHLLPGRVGKIGPDVPPPTPREA